MKVTFFGQVVFPASRAVDDFSDDFQEDVKCPYTIRRSGLESIEIRNVDRVLFGVGPNASAFLHVYVLPVKVDEAAVIRFDVFRNHDLDENKPKSCFSLVGRYLKDKRTLVFTASDLIDPSITNELVSLVFDLVSPQEQCRFFILDATKMRNSYRSANTPDGDTPFLRKISTIQAPDSEFLSKCKYLVVPNILDGLSAAVMTRCEVSKLLGFGLILYSPSCSFDVECVNSFHILKNVPSLTDLIKECNDSTRQLLNRYQESSNVFG